MRRGIKSKFTSVVFAAVVIGSAGVAAAKSSQTHLTPTGEKLMAHYSSILSNLSSEIYQSLPSMDPGMTHPFMHDYRAEASVKPYNPDSPVYMKDVERCQQRAAPLLHMADSVISSDALDARLAEASIIAEATPQGLAAFAQKSAANQQLITHLLSDPKLMIQMQVADGARHGNYGLTMKIYETIEHASKRAHSGMFQRLALATALSQKSRLGFNQGSKFTPLQRYRDYEKAYLAGELDPAFPVLTTWDYRWVIDDPHDNAELDWFRNALKNYEPNLIYDRQYLDIVHTDVKYGNPNAYEKCPGNFLAAGIAGGGECGMRAWIGRAAERAFGIPVWGVKQDGHAAMAEWTPHGWIAPFSAGFAVNWWDHIRGDVFQRETEARSYPKEFMKAVRLQWIGAALGEKAPNGMVPGTGGFWYALADCEERAIVAASHSPVATLDKYGPNHFQSELRPTCVNYYKKLMAKYGPTLAEKVEAQPVPPSAYKISVDQQGDIHIPVAACSQPKKTIRGAVFVKSYLGGLQLHYYRHVHPWTKQSDVNPAPTLTYVVQAPHAGTYALTAKIVVLKPTGLLAVTVNHAAHATPMTMQWTDGAWQKSKPVDITLKKGRNVIKFNASTNFFSATIKYFELTPLR
jgi:hypothetical protein